MLAPKMQLKKYKIKLAVNVLNIAFHMKSLVILINM
jgi:hypothetical protein